MAIYMWREEETPTFTGLCFTAQEANSTVQLNKNGTPTAVNLEISTDGDTWTDYIIGSAITLANVGDKVYMRNKSETTTGFSIDFNNDYKFSMTGKISSSGDITSLLNKNGTTTLSNNCYVAMFQGCDSLTTAPELPATTLADSCYRNMFKGCTSLTTAPELPATTLAKYCYYDMFSLCESLTTLPELPATTLANYCYHSMFSWCTSIKLSETETSEYNIPYRIPTTGTGTSATNALINMFGSTGGTFTGIPTINTTYYLWNQNVEEISTINNSIGSTPAQARLTVDFFTAPYTGNYHITGVVEGSTSGGSIDLRVDGGTEVSGKILINTDDDRVSPDSYSVVPYDCVIHVTQGTTVTLNTRVRSSGGGGGNNFKAFYIE